MLLKFFISIFHWLPEWDFYINWAKTLGSVEINLCALFYSCIKTELLQFGLEFRKVQSIWVDWICSIWTELIDCSSTLVGKWMLYIYIMADIIYVGTLNENFLVFWNTLLFIFIIIYQFIPACLFAILGCSRCWI